MANSAKNAAKDAVLAPAWMPWIGAARAGKAKRKNMGVKQLFQTGRLLLPKAVPAPTAPTAVARIMKVITDAVHSHPPGLLLNAAPVLSHLLRKRRWSS